jgi:hypothetical protein
MDDINYPSWLKAEHILLFRAAFSSGKTVPTGWEDWYSKVDFEHDYLDRPSFLLMPFLYKNLATHNYDHPVMAKLKGIYRRSWLENQVFLEKISPILQRLGQAGVEIALLDDLASILRLYDGQGLRRPYSLDLLIQPGDVRPTLRTLGDLGIWATNPRPERFLRVETPLVFWTYKELAISLAWRVFPREMTTTEAMQVWHHREAVKFGDLKVFTADLETHYLRTCMRVSSSNPEESLMALVDVTRMAAKPPVDMDWTRIMSLAEKYQLVIPLRDTARLVNTILGLPLTEKLLSQLDNTTVNWLEQAEYQLVKQHTPRVFRLAGKRYISYRRSPKEYGWLSFPRYLQFVWGLKRLRSLPTAILQHTRNAFATPRTSEGQV